MEKQLAQEESQARALEVEIKAMLSKKDIIKVERDSQDKTEAELQLSTTNIASSLA